MHTRLIQIFLFMYFCVCFYVYGYIFACELVWHFYLCSRTCVYILLSPFSFQKPLKREPLLFLTFLCNPTVMQILWMSNTIWINNDTLYPLITLYILPYHINPNTYRYWQKTWSCCTKYFTIPFFRWNWYNWGWNSMCHLHIFEPY